MKRIIGLAMVIVSISGCSTAQKQCEGPGAEYNRQQEKQYFSNNKNNPKIKTSAKGYQYEVLKIGSGNQNPSSHNVVIVHYETRSLSGRLIDSSYDRGAPIRFKLSQVIVGWDLALSEMVVGDKRTLYIPAALAYGCKAQPPYIGFDQALVFDVELLEIH